MTDVFGIKGFIPTSMLDWPGKICSTIFLGGCNFRCPFCHNGKLVLDHEGIPDIGLDEILGYLDIRKSWIDGITVTGGEPSIKGNTPTLLRIFKRRGIAVKLDTNGSRPRLLERLLGEGLVDAVFMDVKAPPTVAEYSAAAGVPIDPGLIARSVEILKTSGIEVTFRTTVIPGLVEEAQLAAIRRFLGNVDRFIVQSFRNVETLKPAYSGIEQFDPARVEEMRKAFEISGSTEIARYRPALAG